ncbi:hypothetical protein [Flavobacterium sp. LB3R33]|uniref:hypothetical protein n=1 Tax=Flavobacterium sp. LB3R33 TaxID=3401721 RepID=UPI003AAD2686
MDNYLYPCHYCGNQYKPNRRHKQRFCSNSCRVNSFNLNKKKNSVLKAEGINEPKNRVQIEKMSLSGVGNAAAGALVAKVATDFFTSHDNKPATKKDILNLIRTLKGRYSPINNIPNRQDGARAFYDYQTQTYVYLTKK